MLLLFFVVCGSVDFFALFVIIHYMFIMFCDMSDKDNQSFIETPDNVLYDIFLR